MTWRERFGELDIWKLQGLVYLARIVKETRSILFSIWSIYQTGFCSSAIIEYLPDWFIYSDRDLEVLQKWLERD